MEDAERYKFIRLDENGNIQDAKGWGIRLIFDSNTNSFIWEWAEVSD